MQIALFSYVSYLTTLNRIFTFSLCTLVYNNNDNFLVYSYGLAPGHPFPAGHEDSIAVTKHVMENLENYGIDLTEYLQRVSH